MLNRIFTRNKLTEINSEHFGSNIAIVSLGPNNINNLISTSVALHLCNKFGDVDYLEVNMEKRQDLQGNLSIFEEFNFNERFSSRNLEELSKISSKLNCNDILVRDSTYNHIDKEYNRIFHYEELNAENLKTFNREEGINWFISVNKDDFLNIDQWQRIIIKSHSKHKIVDLTSINNYNDLFKFISICQVIIIILPETIAEIIAHKGFILSQLHSQKYSEKKIIWISKGESSLLPIYKSMGVKYNYHQINLDLRWINRCQKYSKFYYHDEQIYTSLLPFLVELDICVS